MLLIYLAMFSYLNIKNDLLQRAILRGRWTEMRRGPAQETRRAKGRRERGEDTLLAIAW